MARVRGWLQGKKTMLGGLVLIAAGVLGVAFGKLPVDQGAVVIGFGISVAGWAAKADRHQQQILEALTAVAAAGVQARAGNKAAAIDTVEKAVLTDVLVAASTEAKS
jgi:hypothetical protein